MTLAETQAVLTRCLRDDKFREQFYGPEFEEIASQIGLNQQDREQIGAINRDELERLSVYARGQRMKRRQAEYGLFLEHLSRFQDRQEFYREYHQAVTHGQGERLEELCRFDNFAFEYAIDHGLPDYLVDLLRFCSLVCELGETPKVIPCGITDITKSVPSEMIGGNYIISLRRPFAIASFRYDVLRIAEESDPYGEDPSPRPTDLLLQRDWREHKRTRAYPLADHPILAQLAATPLSVMELGAKLPGFSYGFVLRTIRRQHANQVLHATPPDALVS
jgi:hypothetical protein